MYHTVKFELCVYERSTKPNSHLYCALTIRNVTFFLCPLLYVNDAPKQFGRTLEPQKLHTLQCCISINLVEIFSQCLQAYQKLVMQNVSFPTQHAFVCVHVATLEQRIEVWGGGGGRGNNSAVGSPV